MSSHRLRLEKLEARGGKDFEPIECVMLDGTQAEVEAQHAELRASGRNYCVTTIVQHKGQSPNDFRRSQGLRPMDIPGWDDPRPLDDAPDLQTETDTSAPLT